MSTSVSASCYQVYDTRAQAPVKGAECMEYEVIAEGIAQRLNRRSRARAPRYIVLPADPANLPVLGMRS